ncbi:hypothetical protein GCM10028808_43840 [Spirosoma migulaei]
MNPLLNQQDQHDNVEKNRATYTQIVLFFGFARIGLYKGFIRIRQLPTNLFCTFVRKVTQ